MQTKQIKQDFILNDLHYAVKGVKLLFAIIHC